MGNNFQFSTFNFHFSIGLSPMDDITDLPFRQLCKEFGADLLITEFIASEALNRDAEKSLRKMRFTEEQRPIGIQIFGANEDELLRCLDVVEQAQPDFIDINWGCPVRKVAGKGAGSGILQDIPKMLEITASLVKRAHLPVTVKTRLGYNADSMMITDFCEALQDTGIAALSIHGRTKTQMYSGTADWTMIGEVKNNPRMHIPIFGNGDITTAAQAIENKNRYGVDGILIGRAAIGNPWIFEQCHRAFDGLPEREITVAERVEVCRRHLLAAADFKGERTAVFEMRKHYGAYFKGLYNFKPFRLALVSTPSIEETLAVLDRIAEQYS
ncbi:MAG: tRNA dihydrouridine synthase DusB [Bacteroidales bacterium]|nr:tRNA dihydrouridine synthase DusB [Bacteroidales bacterium]